MATNPLKALPVAEAEFRQQALERATQYQQLCKLEAHEPECECQQTEVDLFNSRGCPAHDRNSAWNVALRSLAPTEVLDQYAGDEPEDCPF